MTIPALSSDDLTRIGQSNVPEFISNGYDGEVVPIPTRLLSLSICNMVSSWAVIIVVYLYFILHTHK